MDLTLDNIIFLITSIVGLIAWFVRLEYQVKSQYNQIMELKIKHESLDSKVVERLNKIEQALARIEGFMSANKKYQEGSIL